MTLTFCKARLADALDLAPRLREMDLRELRAVTDDAPAEVLSRDIAGSDFAWAAVIGGRCHALFGVTSFPATPGVGIPWFLSSDIAVKFRREWLEVAPRYLDAMHAKYRTLTNAVHQENAVSIRWLRRMGFQLTEPLQIRGEPFIVFTRTLHV